VYSASSGVDLDLGISPGRDSARLRSIVSGTVAAVPDTACLASEVVGCLDREAADWGIGASPYSRPNATRRSRGRGWQPQAGRSAAPITRFCTEKAVMGAK
jgi:hypothetical protein